MTKDDFNLNDVYSDGLNIHASIIGVVLQFLRTIVPQPGTPPVQETEIVVNVRMSVQQTKFIVYKIVEQLKKVEQDSGVRVMLGRAVQEGGGIDAADWNRFWGYEDGTPAIPATPTTEPTAEVVASPV